MTATDELRKLLDERGVEYRFNESTKVFEWHFEGTDADGSAHATEVDDGINIMACSLTPEQVIAATLGAGTCRWEYPQGVNGWVGYSVCSSCGERFDECVTDVAHYCPNCGAKVER